jgi:DNA-binding transcriptional LysR family regulator
MKVINEGHGPPMRFQEIETFRALMRGATTHKAAALLGVTQPAVSQSLKRLEAQAGVPLFERRKGRLVPTPEAAALLTEVDRMFVGMDAIEQRLRGLRDHGVNTLALACYPAIGLGFMPRALASMLLQASGDRPHVSLQILSSKDVRDRVAMGQCDFGLMADEMPLQGIDHSILASFPGVVVMPAGHRMARQKVVRVEELAREPFLALNPEDASRQRLDAMLAQRGVTLRVAAHTPYAASVCEMALRGLGVGVVNPITALDYAERGLVVRRLSEDVRFACILALPPGKPLSTLAQRCLVVIRKQLAADEQRLRSLLK